nr:30s ribosomal protein s18 [Quercus suber]
MALESAMRRLQLVQGSSLSCQQCRRTITSSAKMLQRQQQNSTGAMADEELLASSQKEDAPAIGARSQQSRTTIPPPPSAPSPSSPFNYASVIEQAASRPRPANATAATDFNREFSRRDLEQQQSRRWRLGDVYAPHDLSGVEMSKWKKLQRRAPASSGKIKTDVLDQMGIDPRKEYKNVAMMSEYISPMGRIMSGKESGLRPVNQRRMAKAIRRAMGLGLMPTVHRHPEIIREELAKRDRGVLRTRSGVF